MMRFPTARLRTRPLPPFFFAARLMAAAIRVPRVFFAIKTTLGTITPGKELINGCKMAFQDI
ncbi:hypothetical protein HY994_02395 [Candidatus Micrarchaeota archaeon]|nr:hypothetical protein [Candidatus Micrarchaeota archaeon]